MSGLGTSTATQNTNQNTAFSNTGSSNENQYGSSTSNLTQNQNQNQNGTSAQNTSSATSAWAPAMTSAKGILSQLNGLIPNAGLNQAQTNAINQLTAGGQAGNPYSSAIGGVASSLLGGGGATNQAGAVNQAYQNYYKATNPLASNTNYDPYSTPGIGTQLQGLQDQITQNINGQFAAAGRDGSGANSRALATGLAQGMAPILTSQYNQNVQNQQNAASNLYGAGNATANALSNYNQQGVNNQLQGITSANDALNAQNWGANQVLNAQNLLSSIPSQNLGLLSNIVTQLGGLGSTSSGAATGSNTNNTSMTGNQSGMNTSNMTGTSNSASSGTGSSNGVTKTSSTASPIQNFTGIMGGLGSLFGRR